MSHAVHASRQHLQQSPRQAQNDVVELLQSFLFTEVSLRPAADAGCQYQQTCFSAIDQALHMISCACLIIRATAFRSQTHSVHLPMLTFQVGDRKCGQKVICNSSRVAELPRHAIHTGVVEIKHWHVTCIVLVRTSTSMVFEEEAIEEEAIESGGQTITSQCHRLRTASEAIAQLSRFSELIGLSGYPLHICCVPCVPYVIHPGQLCGPATSV